MTNTQTISSSLTDLMNLTDYPWHLTKWGVPEITLPDEQYSICVSEDDGTYYLVDIAAAADKTLAHDNSGQRNAGGVVNDSGTNSSKVNNTTVA